MIQRVVTLRVRVSGALVRNGHLLLIEHTKNSEIYYLLPGEVIQLVQNISPDGSRNIFHVIFTVRSSDDPKLSEFGGRVTGFRWLDTCELDVVTELVFYPPVLEHLLELLNNSSYNGIELRMPGWQE